MLIPQLSPNDKKFNPITDVNDLFLYEWRIRGDLIANFWFGFLGMCLLHDT